MKMKTKKNKSSAKKLIIILSLSLALIIALGAATFAWIKNYVEINTLNLESGKMLYSLKLYQLDENGNIIKTSDGQDFDVIFDTDRPEDAEAAEYESCKKTLSAESMLVDVNKGEELFFVIEKHPESIEFDAAISFDNKGLSADYNNIGEISYQICEEKNKITDVAEYLANPGENIGKLEEGLSSIFNVVQKTSLPDGTTISCIRLKLDRSAATNAVLELPLRLNFCVAQKDKLPDNPKSPEPLYVYDAAQLKDVMNKYGFGDEIRIMEDIDDYQGDLVFTRPCKLTVMHSTLTVKGNISFSYIYDGDFEINTVSDGHIRIVKSVPDSNGERVGGNFRIDLPNSKIELSGANNEESGKADIYAEGDFSANAANLEEKGLIFKGIRICDISTVTTPVTKDNKTTYEYTFNYSSSLKDMTVNGPSRISTSIRTRLGSLLTNLYCSSITIENNGYIQSVNLENMTCDTTYDIVPAIFIQNAGAIGTSQATDENNIIRLPESSMKFDEKSGSSSADNVQIKAAEGSEFIRALTKGSGDDFSKAANQISKFFFSNGNAGRDGYRDDIEYSLRTVFVEKVNGDKTKIVVHYETPASSVLDIEKYSDLSSLDGLKSYIDYYADIDKDSSAEEWKKALDIAAIDELTEVTIVCHGDKVLTSTSNKTGDVLTDDYDFIKTMTNLVKLDLSDAVSKDKSVPNNAFKNMSKLQYIDMSESDTTWGQYIFTGTAADEITFPQSLTKLDNPRTSSGSASSQFVLDGIKYVYTSVTVVDGFEFNSSSAPKQYLFTPDNYTYNSYRALFKNSYWHSRIFVGEGVERYGEFFLRCDTSDESYLTCEFVTFAGDISYTAEDGKTYSWVEHEDIKNKESGYGFDFKEIKLEDDIYLITSYDPYALYDKLIEADGLEVTISNNVTDIGEYAFASGINTKATKGLSYVTIEGNPNIKGYTFAYNDVLKSFSAPNLTKLSGGYNLSNNDMLEDVYMPKLREVEGSGDVSKCKSIKNVHIGVVEYTNNNKDFYTSSDDYTYARFYIHAENVDSQAIYSEDYKALAADNRHIFVKSGYEKYYKNTGYTGVTEMGDNDIDELMAADENCIKIAPESNDDPAYYYVVDDKNNAQLVACLLPTIDKSNDSYGYTTPNSFDGKQVTYIGSASYHFTSIIAHNIKISDNVKQVGDYAFDSRNSLFKKYCITFDLNAVEIAGKNAFYYVDMARVIGDKLEEVGKDTFSYNQSLAVVKLPNLSRSRPKDTNITPQTVFEGCKELRILYAGFSENISYDNKASRAKNYIRFINFISGPNEINIAKVNTVINTDVSGVGSSFNNNFVEVNKNFDGIYFSDYYDYTINFMGLSDIIELPGYIYYQTEVTGEGQDETISLSLIAVSPDLEKFGDFRAEEDTLGSNYYTPGVFSKAINSKSQEINSNFKVTSLGNHAYGAVNFKDINTFFVADTIEKICNGALRGSAYSIENDNDIVTLSGVKALNLANVIEVESYACYNAKMSELKALKLQKIGTQAFRGCSLLTSVYLPAFVDNTGTYAFRDCKLLEEITFGENAIKLDSNIFNGCTALRKITILNSTQVVTIGSSVVDKTHVQNLSNKNITMVVSIPMAVYDDYEALYSDGFGNIPFSCFTTFENASEFDGLTYYWNVISDEAGNRTAYIDYIEGTIASGRLELPSKIWKKDSDGNRVGEEYTVVSVSAQVMMSISGVSTVVLPSEMQYLSFTTADLASSITALEISDNSKFGTSEGVLYAKDSNGNLAVLLVYPKAKAASSLTVANTVTTISAGAFYGATNLTTLNVAGNITIYDRAFEGSAISKLNFTAASGVSVFEGRDIFRGVNLDALEIFVPSGKLESYKANVLVDYAIIDCFKAS